MDFLRQNVFPYWKSILVILIPLALLPLPVVIPTSESRCGYVVILMALYWMTEAVPLAITSLLPVVLFPLLGIMSTGDVCIAYMKETNMMFIGGLMVAIAIEHCNLHKRIALGVLLMVGSSPRWLMLGFMITTMFLSMWISNTAATAMMVPIVLAIIDEIYKDEEEEVFHDEYMSNELKLEEKPTKEEEYLESVVSSQQVIVTARKPDKRKVSDEEVGQKNTRDAMMFSVSFSSNIGGTGTLTGTPPNLAMKATLNSLYPEQTDMNFATWMAFNVPGMLINVFIAWIWLQLLFIGFDWKAERENKQAQQKARALIKMKLKELGPMTFHEAMVLTLFIILALLWFFRDPQFIPGWAAPWHEIGIQVEDATAAILIVTLMFMIPAQPDFWCLRPKEATGKVKAGPALLNWQVCQDKIPWGIVLLLGGGFALSDAVKVSGLSDWLGIQLEGLKVLPQFAILVIVCVMTAIVTEVASNTATANILLPVLAKMSEQIGVNPLYLMLPAAVTCSYAFMLPVATPPNAIVFTAGKMKAKEMIKTGFMMNIFCVIVLCALTETLGVALFDIKTFPDWANKTEITIVSP
ncbi:Na(+)/citrate cotransporter-like isoform X2 [Artemia franciscana]|uniref:Uncharacterized protein n=1 Tax=Artemia franciscana TaxID=6661 RepID=A0AA88I2A6_ARTSF|nr:hypothetical protein QYM36_008568 [Artemia franciscana]